MSDTHRCSVCRSHTPHAELKMIRTHFVYEDGSEAEDVPMTAGLCLPCIQRLAAGQDLEITENVYP